MKIEIDTRELYDAADLNQAQFAKLAVEDVLEWLRLFFGSVESRITHKDVYEYEDYGPKQSVHGMYIKCVESEGGGEGGGEYVGRVFGIFKPIGESDDEGVAYFFKSGTYNSYEGTEWDPDLSVVYPQQVVVTRYMTAEYLAKYKENNAL